MAGCGKPTNGGHKVEGAPLHCGMSLYWKSAEGNDRARTQEIVLCDECKEGTCPASTTNTN